MTLTIKDLEKLQTILQNEQLDYKTVLTDGETLTIPELLPGWELAIAELWPPVFD